jgi:diguanylate cyclase (GGDEF)-like protein/PAS domain S-box-containing protein
LDDEGVALGDVAIPLTSFLEATGDGYVEVDATGTTVAWSERAARLFGWSAAAAVGRPIDQLIVVGGAEGDGERSISWTLRRFEAGQGPIPRRVRGRNPWPIEVELVACPIPHPDGTRYAASFRAVSHRRSDEDRLARRTGRDELTGLANRRRVIEQLQHLLAQLPHRELPTSELIGVLSVDVDRFKVVNESVGRRAGDRLLRQLAGRLHTTANGDDLLARVAGDEFVVVALGRADVAEVLSFAEEIAVSLSEPFWVNGRELRPTASIGVAVTRRAGAAETLVRDADTAMHQAKSDGGNRIELFTPQMHRTAVHHFQLEGELQSAVSRDQLRVAYQPIVKLDGTVVGAEALVRWQHPTRGLLLPADFIPVAERTGLLADIGREVLLRACRDAASWARTAPDAFRLNVNVAAVQLDDPGFADMVQHALDQTGLDPSRLCLEITESALMSDGPGAKASLERLCALGCTAAVDDFGTGYSPLLNLRYFPVTVIKLDRSFVANLERHGKDQAIVGAVIELAHAIDMTTVAEGVETAAQRDILVGLGCDLGQGFFWRHPVPPEELAELLALPSPQPQASPQPQPYPSRQS